VSVFNVYRWVGPPVSGRAELVASLEARNTVDAIRKAGGSAFPNRAGIEHLFARPAYRDEYAKDPK
jgi:hypothetical protein